MKLKIFDRRWNQYITEIIVGVLAHAQATTPPQVPLCMIGDSITWAGDGDYWRQYLVEQMPTLAFVGTHSAVLGYSHAGEGGNSTVQVRKVRSGY